MEEEDEISETARKASGTTSILPRKPPSSTSLQNMVWVILFLDDAIFWYFSFVDVEDDGMKLLKIRFGRFVEIDDDEIILYIYNADN